MAETTTRSRNPRGEGGRLRAEIVAAAVELLDETSDQSTITLRSVARRVGIAAPSIYRHFPDQPAIMLAVVQQAFGELEAQLGAALTGDDPRERLLAICHAYLRFAEDHPSRYRTMFGGVWMPALDDSTSITEQDVSTLGDNCIRLLTEALTDCVNAGVATSTDPHADTVALWLGMHGLAHQKAVTVSFPWPPDIAERVITTLTHLTDGV